MIVRMWHGRVPHEKAEAYREFLIGRAIPDYSSVSGNLFVQILERVEADATHFITLTHWKDLESIRAFAGDDLEVAKYYPEDDRYLLSKDPSSRNWRVFHADG